MKAGSECVCVCVRVLLTHPLVVLLLLDLLHLVQQLSHSQLQLSQLVLGCDLRVVVGVFSHLDVQMDPLEGEDKPGVSVRDEQVRIHVHSCRQALSVSLLFSRRPALSNSLVMKQADHMTLTRATPTNT